MSLADALRQLQESTAQLQLPYESMGAPSYQSLQCSSGYGTMTNVSASSAETISSNCTGKIFKRYATISTRSIRSADMKDSDYEIFKILLCEIQ